MTLCSLRKAGKNRENGSGGIFFSRIGPFPFSQERVYAITKGTQSTKETCMKHKVRLTVLDKKLYPELQQQYCADPASGACPCYNVGDVFEFYRDGDRDDFWRCGINTLVQTTADPATVAGGPGMPHCSELWDAIARYIYTGLQGGSIMKGWMAKENEMITCCSDGTRPVIFKIERIDYED